MREENPELLHGILSKLADNIGDYACYQVDQGAQVIQVFDSWAGHLPKDQYETFAMPYQKRVVEAIKAKHPTTPVIIYMAPDIHSKDGQFLDLLATTGVNCVSLDYTVDFADVRAKMPDHLALQGNLDPKLLRDGPLEKIKEETEKILQAGAHNGHVMNLGHGIEADTPEPHAKFSSTRSGPGRSEGLGRSRSQTSLAEPSLPSPAPCSGATASSARSASFASTACRRLGKVAVPNDICRTNHPSRPRNRKSAPTSRPGPPRAPRFARRRAGGTELCIP